MSALACTALLSQPSAQAHHYFAALFDIDKNIAVQGVVTDFSFENPHVLIWLEVENSDGTTTSWISQGEAATRFRLAGWNEDTINLGDYIRVIGKGTHDNSPGIWIEQIELLAPITGALIKELNPHDYSEPEEN